MLNEELRIALSMALERARKERHEFLTLEHVLLALIYEPGTAEILESCGADLSRLEKDLEVVLATASPYEAQDYTDSGEEIVEKVMMPPGLVAWVRDFVRRPSHCRADATVAATSYRDSALNLKPRLRRSPRRCRPWGHAMCAR